MCFVFIWEQRETCATYSINWLVFITEMKSVYSAVRTGSLNKAYWSRDAPPGLTFNNCTLCPHCIYVFCIIWEQTATCATYSINWLVFITEMKSIYSAVRTGFLIKPTCYVMHQQFNIQQLYVLPTVFICFVFIWEQTATCATYSIYWLVFITQMKSVYSAVRTRYFNKAACASSLKGLKHYRKN